MIRTQLTTSLTAAGCTRIIYDTPHLANVLADESLQTDLIGIILEPDGLNLIQQGNGFVERFNTTTVEILKQVAAEDLATNNEAALQQCLNACKLFINSIAHSGSFQKVPATIPVTKVTEARYDANVIGWSMRIDLQPVNNVNIC